MIPDDFLNFALRLSAASGEAEKRTAVSRAYYAIFHAARIFLEQDGIHCPPSAEAHAKIAMCLKHSEDEEALAAADELNSLRALRNKADYQLAATNFRDPNLIQYQLAIAKRLFTLFSQTNHKFSSVRLKMRVYARDVLKMNVQESV